MDFTFTHAAGGVGVSTRVVAVRVVRRLLSGLVVMASTAGAAHALDWQTLWQRPDQVAYKKLQSGDAKAAAEVFDDPQWRGVSQYRAGEFEAAQKEFSTVDGETGLYNQAVTAVQQAEYDAAIEKFESLLSQYPDHQDAQHNLEIARELARQQEQQQQQQQQENSDQDNQSEDQQKQDQENQTEGEGSSSDSESSSDEQGDSESRDKPSGGDLTTTAEDAAQQQSEANSQQSEQQQAEQIEQQAAQQAEPGEDELQDSENTVAASTAPSESEQATEQWLRRIPDDPSQLLRNKIKLNHMIEHADVRDMREPW